MTRKVLKPKGRALYELTNAGRKSGFQRRMTPKEAAAKNKDFADHKWPERWKAAQ